MNKAIVGLYALGILLAGLAGLGGTAALASPVPAGVRDSVVLSERPGGVEVRHGHTITRITALTDAILRVRIAPSGRLPEDASWAVDASTRAGRAATHATTDGFTTAAVRVRIDRTSARLTVEDLAGHVISQDAADPIDIDGRAFTLNKQLPVSEHIFALGDKTGGTLDRRGKSFVDWNTDSYGFDSSTDPIYKSIPFFIGVGGAGGSYGILFDNTWRAWFDFGHRDADTTAFGAPDGPIDYYVIAGPSTAEVVRRYTDLTGKAPLAPLWALGYQQSRYSYMSADEVRDIAATLRKDKIPTDVIWLDIDFQDRNRPFTVNAKTFPDMKGLVGDLDKQGIKLVAITDLHVADAPNEHYAPYDSGIAGDHFVHNPDGSIYVGKVWPGASVFPDFTDAAARTWWGTNFKQFADDGIAGFWNDMNEPSVFETPTATMPLDIVHHVDSDDFASRKATHAEIHNVFGMENTRATYDGLKTLRPDERGFVMTRASYAGGQRYAVTWTGDNSATWDHLKLSIHQLINLGLSGFSYAAADVGGFTGGPSPDLLTRWFEIGAFTPVFRDHAAKGTPRAEPWVDGPEQLAIRRRFVEERYRLMPYLYALADRNARTGDPIMRPVFYDYPEMLGASCDQSTDFTLGRDLLIAPPPKIESPQRYDVCLPAGGWYDYWTGLPVEAATAAGTTTPTVENAGAVQPTGTRLTETPKLDRLPVFVRAGAILPRQPLVQSTADIPQGPLSLDIYPGPDCAGTLYLDDGHSMAFQRGHFLRQEISCRSTENGGLEIDFAARNGDYAPWWHAFTITIHGWSGAAKVRYQGAAKQAEVDDTAKTLTVVLPDMVSAGRLSIDRAS